MKSCPCRCHKKQEEPEDTSWEEPLTEADILRAIEVLKAQKPDDQFVPPYVPIHLVERLLASQEKRVREECIAALPPVMELPGGIGYEQGKGYNRYRDKAIAALRSLDTPTNE